ncbi:hypothetical protein KO02_23355 [Sphingobacterium sp. ML3W]|uniref:hypothetical protein n=1 Tax=Sphingobacterium sp. ML3W TaxID=1538644 RepID=UPI0004F9115E|nr:hypothetical protein [Sphingobacterium sp. ML3W]AIM39302.1 hypothetical protein KO02_23355 [Sphingobacterium sp. ML3W]
MKKVIHNLLAPSAHLFLISKYLNKDELNKLVYNLINEDYLLILEYLDSLIIQIKEKDIKDRNEDELYLSLLITNFKESVREIYIDYQHLEYHYEAQKSLSVFKIIEDTLSKYNITNSSTIAKEVIKEYSNAQDEIKIADRIYSNILKKDDTPTPKSTKISTKESARDKVRGKALEDSLKAKRDN